MTEANKAVFLSYAREDSAAAQQLADALRAFGIEVWFDQSELRGGDSWDAKIRTQIKTCTLFIPIVSAQTEARGEGYFRREWKLAADRTHDMGAGRAFLVPVVIDDTNETGADVPEEFLRYQWIRLPDGAPTPQFVEQVKRLLASPRHPVASAARSETAPRSGTAPRAAAPEAATATPAGGAEVPPLRAAKSPALKFALTAGALAVVAVSAALFFTQRGAPTTPPVAGVADPGPASARPATALASSPSVSRPATATASPAALDKSIAVLPFANMSAEKDAEFFADGVHEDLLTALAKVRDLKVISRTSVLGYRDTTKRNLRQIATELGVAHVLEGSVRRAGNKARITVQLIDARTDQHLWAESYDRDVTDIFAVQGEVAREITTALKASLTPGEQKLIGRRATQDTEAYDLYLKARLLEQSLQVFSPKEDYDRVSELYDAATRRDPSFALAWVQASIAHGTQFWFAALDPTPERRAKAAFALAKARELAPNSPEVRLAQGSFAYLCENDWRGALVEYRAAEAALPNDSQLLYRMALAHRRVGELREAEQLLQRVATLSPSDIRGITTLMETQLFSRLHREAVETFNRYRALLAKDGQAVEFLLWANLELTGDFDAYFRAAASSPPRASDRHGLYAVYSLSLERGDLVGASAVLGDPRWKAVPTSGGVIAEPIALHRAQIAWLQGRGEDAQRWASEAIAAIEGGTWTERQMPFAQMAIARAKACAGRHDEAVRQARAVFAEQERTDKFVVGFMRVWLGRILIAAGRPDEALEELRLHVASPIGYPSTQSFFLDPFWARLRSDPRFTEIIQPTRPPKAETRR